jgi:hypothetical protein
MKRLLLAALLALGMTPAMGGTASYNAKTHVLHMVGETNLELKIETINLINKHRDEIREVSMWGQGGSAVQMVVLMKEITKLDVPVVIPYGRFCASACALVAISSSQTIVNGVLMFHMGYHAQYPSDITLYQVMQAGQVMTTDILYDTYLIGMKQNFLEKLIQYTNRDKWFAITHTKQLDNCRMNGSSNYHTYMETCYIPAPVLSTQKSLDLLKKGN